MTTREDKVAFIAFKSFLFLVGALFALAALLLIILFASAATVTGSSPFLAISMTNGVNTGLLGPGEQRWFKFIPDKPQQAVQVEKALTLVFTPADAQRISQVSFQLFDEGQSSLFYQGDAGRMANFGAGQIVDRDRNPETGELFWTGWLFAGNSYYLQLMNGSEVTVDYWLFPDNMIGYSPGEPEAPATAVPLAGGAAPQTAIPLNSDVNQGSLDPGAETWYSFRVADFDQEYFEEMALTMITTPDDGQRIRAMTFDVFTAGEIQHWSPGNDSQLNNMGAGSIVFRDDNPLTGERFWDGWVIENGLYYVRVRNGTDTRMDYWLFSADVYGPELGQFMPEANPG